MARSDVQGELDGRHSGTTYQVLPQGGQRRCMHQHHAPVAQLSATAVGLESQ
jgi:hypothetical protein